MPVLTRLFVKSSLVYFVAALLAGLILATRGIWDLVPFFTALGPVYFHMFLVGWITQIIFGIAYWMFPKYSLQNPRGNEKLAWATFWLLNSGLILRVIFEPLNTINPGPGFGLLLAGSALLQWIAGLCFVANTWARVKEK